MGSKGEGQTEGEAGNECGKGETQDGEGGGGGREEEEEEEERQRWSHVRWASAVALCGTCSGCTTWG